MPNEEQELKPCPWCNNPDDFYVSGDDDDPNDDCVVECMFCHCEGPAKPTKAEAIAAWNTRTETALESRLIEALGACVAIMENLPTLGGFGGLAVLENAKLMLPKKGD